MLKFCQCFPTRVPLSPDFWQNVIRGSAEIRNVNTDNTVENFKYSSQKQGKFAPGIGNTAIMSARQQLPLCFAFVYACQGSLGCEQLLRKVLNGRKIGQRGLLANKINFVGFQASAEK